MSHFPLSDPPLTVRYLVSTDGWTAANRLDKLPLLGSVILKQDSPRYALRQYTYCTALQ